MKFAYKEGGEIPPFDGTEKKFVVEQTEGGFWCHDANFRSAGSLADSPLSEVLKWIVRQMIYGHYFEETDESGEVVSLSIGKQIPFDVPTKEDAAKEVAKASLAVNIAGLIAEAREKGTSANTYEFEKTLWGKATINAHRRMEMHYALVFCELLGRVSKKLKKLDLLPIMESARESTRDYLAEATRCYLLKMDRACITLCRACVEHTLKGILTQDMEREWKELIKNGRPKKIGPMEALIEVCAKHGALGAHAKPAHEIRVAGNKVLHQNTEDFVSPKSDPAGSVLKKTRKLINFIHGK